MKRTLGADGAIELGEGGSGLPVMFNTILIQEGIDPVQVCLLRLRKRRKGLLFVVPTPKRTRRNCGRSPN
jgi:hypothetical protein